MKTKVTFWQGRPVANFWFNDTMTDDEALIAVRKRIDVDWAKSPTLLLILEHARDDIKIEHLS